VTGSRHGPEHPVASNGGCRAAVLTLREQSSDSKACQDRCASRPTTTTQLPLASDPAACSAWSRHTTTVKNDASPSFHPSPSRTRPETATRNVALAVLLVV
jgi:hypothetical protein